MFGSNRSFVLVLLAIVAAATACEEEPAWGTRVIGRVTVTHGPDTFSIPNARVVLRDQAVGGWGKKQIQADSTGRYDMDVTPQAGTFEMCADSPQLPLACNPTGVEFYFPSTIPSRDINIVATDALHGRVLLADGVTPCAGPAQIELGQYFQQEPIIATTEANPEGHWVLSVAGIPNGTYLYVGGRCGSAATTSSSFTLDDAFRSGATSFDQQVLNLPPVIDRIAIVDGPDPITGTVVRDVPPGFTGFLRVDYTDPFDTLTFSWSDESGSVVPANAAAIPWTAPSHSQLDTIYVEIDDGRGGVAREALQVRIGANEDRFIGNVYDAGTGAPLAGATVQVDGVGNTAATDSNGHFGLSLAGGQFHYMQVNLAGYAPHVERFEGGAAGLNIRLHPMTAYNVDPTQDIEVWDGDRGFSVFIPANSLESESGGGAPPGNVDIWIHTRDGDTEKPLGGRREVGGSSVQLFEPIQTASVEITDGTGATYNLSAGAEATVGFAAPDVTAQPGTLPLMHLDENISEWTEMTELVQRHSRYEGPVSSFSSWTTGQYSPFWEACARVEIKGGVQLPQLLRVYWWDPDAGIHTQSLIDEYTLQEHDNVVYYLPENRDIVFQLRAFSDPDNILSTAQAATGGGVNPAEPPYPYSPCQRVELGIRAPAETRPNSSPPRYLHRLGTGDEATAQAYYASIGALPAKDDFQKWLDVNEFPAGAAANDVTFFNPNELGLTRRANCNKFFISGIQQFACYVTKFGKLGEAPQNSLWDGLTGVDAGDTVAMEFTAEAGGDPFESRSVKFYIYAPGATPSQQPIKTKTAFDTDGESKYVPNVCEHCHGAGQSQWVVFDAHEYQYLGVGQSHLPNVQEQLREWNSYVATVAGATQPSFGGPHPVNELLNDMYGPGNVHTPGSTASPALKGDPIYDEIAKPYCRTCHMWSAFPFNAPGPFTQGGPSIDYRICQGEMPHAMGPQLAFWSSANPWLPGLLDNHLPGGLPCVTATEPPEIQITGPSAGAEVGFGGLMLNTYTADATDLEDGASCCYVEWSSDEGVMGYGTEIQYTFATPGNHIVCAKAVDSNAKEAEDCIDVDSTNSAPSAVIHDPFHGQNILIGNPYGVVGEAFDTNETYFEVDCSQLVWDFSFVPGVQPTPSSATGCHAGFTFNSVGFHTVRLTATDSFGLTGVHEVVINAQPVPPNSPPGVYISDPKEGFLYPWESPMDIVATVTSNGGGAISLNWTADWGAGPVSISTVSPDTWTPSDDMPANCGAQNIDLRATATDSHGTNFDEVQVEILTPPC